MHPSCRVAVLQPQRGRNLAGLGSSPVARHYWGNHCLFSLPAGTKMFQFPAFASAIGRIVRLQRTGLSHSEIRGSIGHLRLTPAYRSLSRPSSPVRAKASAMRPCLLSRTSVEYTFSCISRSFALHLLLCVQYVKDRGRLHGRRSGNGGRGPPAGRFPRVPLTGTKNSQDHETNRRITSVYFSPTYASLRRPLFSIAPERRCSSRTFRYGYLVTT